MANPSDVVGQAKIGWDDYFMAVASLSAQRSKDPNTKVGACIVNEEKRIVGTGYNGMPDPNSLDENDLQLKELWNSKKHFVCHAVMNAVLNRNAANLKHCTLFTTRFPCSNCAKLIIQAGIKEVIYLEMPGGSEYQDSNLLLKITNVSFRELKQEVVIELKTK